MDVYCDNEICIYHCEGECQRTSVKIERLGSPIVMTCLSLEQRKAPARLASEQGQEK